VVKSDHSQAVEDVAFLHTISVKVLDQLRLLSKVVEGIPEVKNYEVAKSTLHNPHRSAARAAAAA